MAGFITHVDLLFASETDYEKLDRAMQALHFYKTIQDLSTGIVYQLPVHMYYSSSEDDSSFVLQQAKNAAKKTKRNYTAITIRADGIQFSGLERCP
jgi:hypothetical protein